MLKPREWGKTLGLAVPLEARAMGGRTETIFHRKWRTVDADFKSGRDTGRTKTDPLYIPCIVERIQRRTSSSIPSL